MLALFLEWLRNWQILKKGSASWVSENFQQAVLWNDRWINILHTEVTWLSKSKCLTRICDSHEELAVFSYWKKEKLDLNICSAKMRNLSKFHILQFCLSRWINWIIPCRTPFITDLNGQIKYFQTNVDMSKFKGKMMYIFPNSGWSPRREKQCHWLE
jgi:hypothetical protein